MKYDFTYLSLGAGVQSSALFIMSALGLHGCPPADVAIFSDTGDEPMWVYDQLHALRQFGFRHGLEVEIVKRKGPGLAAKMRADYERGIKRPINIPVWARSSNGRPAPASRSCTREFKIDVLNANAKRHLGYRSRQRVKKRAAAMIGISTNEAHRAKDSPKDWITNLYPLLDARMDRQACLELVEAHGLPTPKRSACVYCPFTGRDGWQNLKENHPREWAKALEVDELLRTPGITPDPCYLTPLMKPLAEMDFSSKQLDMFDDGFGNECEGLCGV